MNYMNALEIIAEIDQLPEAEKCKVIEYIRKLPNATTVEAMNEQVEEGPSFKNASELLAALDDEC